MAPSAKAKAKAAQSKAPAKAAAMAPASASPDDRARAALATMSKPSPLTPWSADSDRSLLDLGSHGQVRDDVACLFSGPGITDLSHIQDLCATLRSGHYEVAERCCEVGGVESTLALMTDPLQEASLRAHAAEALWLLVRDHESCIRVIQAGGHDSVIKLVKSEGQSGTGTIVGGALRVLGETLYSEPRSSGLWTSDRPSILIEALDWVLRIDSHDQRGPLLLTVCSLSALWVCRANGAAIRSVLPLLGLLPRLVRRLKEHQEEPDIIFEGSRLMHALSWRCRSWPEDIRAPVLAALDGLSKPQDESLEEQASQIHDVNQKALEAVRNMQPAAPGSLMEMD
mmetsp:Transcript_64063/g.134686  ORF Transcript_64063/g.134686 Transcript_64063/m.134686 type:complete len:341 (+) Transcript_64063:70-1092(+)